MQATVTDITTLPLMLRVEDIQRVLGISRMMAYGMIHQAGCPKVLCGRSIRIPRDSFLRWLEEKAGANGERPR